MKRLAFLSLLLCLGACSEEAGVNEDNTCSPSALPGDLVITELFTNPVGADEGFEWIEVYNASSIPQCMNNLRVQVKASKSDKSYYITSPNAIRLEPGAYMVLAESDLAQPSYVFSKPLAMPNTAGTVSLFLGADELDSVAYGELEGAVAPAPAEGKSLSLCGECLSSTCNDATDSWGQTLEQPYSDNGNAGSPARANTTCDCIPPAGATSIRAPIPGDLVFSELFADAPGEDGNQEWFEVRVVASDAAISLSGVGIVTSKGAAPILTIPEKFCLAASPSDWLLFARSGDIAVNGNIVPDYVYGSKLTLKNTSGYLALVLGTTVLAETTWDKAPAGRSSQYDFDDSSWCESNVPFGSNGGFGSPGEPNFSCSIATCILDGQPVEALSPQPGDVRFNELLANTPGSEEADAEWIELLVTGASAVDLNGLELWKSGADKAAHIIQPADAACLRFQPGDIVLLARSNNPAANGIDPEKVDYLYASLSLNNEDTLSLKLGTTVIDELTYDASQDGASLARDSSGSWCVGTKPNPIGADKTMLGTPGDPNTPCGALYCLDQGTSRAVSFPAPGTVVIAEVFADPNGTDKAAAEWLELLFTSDAAGKDLNGLELWIDGTLEASLGASLTQCTAIQTGSCLLAGSADSAANGGLTLVKVALPSWSLPNSAATYAIKANGVLLDEVSLPAPTAGKATQLDPAKATPEGNDDASAWCNATPAYNPAGDTGTPGSPNPACGASLCMNGEGLWVPAISPQTGDLVLSEIFANTPGNEDANKEWFEVFVPPATPTFHFQGISLLKTAGGEAVYTFSAQTCIEMVANNYYVFCRNAVSAENGGLPACIPYTSLQLNNDGYLALALGTLVLDAVPAYGPVQDGASWSLDPDALNSDSNDVVSAWCSTPATATYGTGSRGTPGLPNPQCP